MLPGIKWNMKLSRLFEKCISVPYITVENGASFAAERLGSRLQLYFEASHGAIDWENNLDFPAMPYKRMGERVWFAHRGFLRVWRSAEKHLEQTIRDPTVRSIVITGYSHGAALAVLCHEYIWFHRPDLRQQLTGYGFGCPRVVWGPAPWERWAGFTVVRNIDDPVTHLPPAALGYTHVGTLLEIGKRGAYPAADAHRAESYQKELDKLTF